MWRGVVEKGKVGNLHSKGCWTGRFHQPYSDPGPPKLRMGAFSAKCPTRSVSVIGTPQSVFKNMSIKFPRLKPPRASQGNFFLGPIITRSLKSLDSPGQQTEPCFLQRLWWWSWRQGNLSLATGRNEDRAEKLHNAAWNLKIPPKGFQKHLHTICFRVQNVMDSVPSQEEITVVFPKQQHSFLRGELLSGKKYLAWRWQSRNPKSEQFAPETGPQKVPETHLKQCDGC